MADRFAEIERLIGQDPARRGIGGLIQAGHLKQAAKSLISANKVGIVSGFFVPKAQAGETDGPPGAQAIGNALAVLGIPSAYITDQPNASCFEALGAEPLYIASSGPGPGPLKIGEIFPDGPPTHLVAVERLGRAADGRYYNMRGEDVTPFTAPLDDLFLAAAAEGITSIAIGDGGNEIGMGNVSGIVAKDVHLGDRIGSVVATDYLIVSGISNWGAFGLVGALSLLAGQDLLPSPEQARQAVQNLVAQGAVDGNTLRREPTVDGQKLQPYLEVLTQIQALL